MTVAEKVREQIAILRLVGEHDPRVIRVAEKLMLLFCRWDAEMSVAEAKEWLEIALQTATNVVRAHDNRYGSGRERRH